MQAWVASFPYSMAFSLGMRQPVAIAEDEVGAPVEDRGRPAIETARQLAGTTADELEPGRGEVGDLDVATDAAPEEPGANTTGNETSGSDPGSAVEETWLVTVVVRSPGTLDLASGATVIVKNTRNLASETVTTDVNGEAIVDLYALSLDDPLDGDAILVQASQADGSAENTFTLVLVDDGKTVQLVLEEDALPADGGDPGPSSSDGTSGDGTGGDGTDGTDGEEVEPVPAPAALSGLMVLAALGGTRRRRA